MQKKVEQWNVLSEIKTNANGLLTLVPHPKTPSLCRLGGGGCTRFGRARGHPWYWHSDWQQPILLFQWNLHVCLATLPNQIIIKKIIKQDDSSLPCWWLFVPLRRVGDNIGWDERTKSATRAPLPPQSKSHTEKIWQRKRKTFSGQDPNFNKCFQAVFQYTRQHYITLRIVIYDTRYEKSRQIFKIVIWW